MFGRPLPADIAGPVEVAGRRLGFVQRDAILKKGGQRRPLSLLLGEAQSPAGGGDCAGKPAGPGVFGTVVVRSRVSRQRSR